MPAPLRSDRRILAVRAENFDWRSTTLIALRPGVAPSRVQQLNMQLLEAFRTAWPHLEEHQYAVVDDALDEVTLQQLHTEMSRLRDAGVLRQHRFGFRKDAQKPVQIFSKPHIYEAELQDELVQRSSPTLCSTLRDLCVPQHAAEAFPGLHLLRDSSASDPLDGGSVVVKLQCNEGQGGPSHTSNAHRLSSTRLLPCSRQLQAAAFPSTMIMPDHHQSVD